MNSVRPSVCGERRMMVEEVEVVEVEVARLLTWAMQTGMLQPEVVLCCVLEVERGFKRNDLPRRRVDSRDTEDDNLLLLSSPGHIVSSII